jgi:small redox-active disulfide protein 2
MKIEILGTGCAKCNTTEKIIKKVVEELGINADIVKVEDLQEIINRGIMMTPAVFINGEEKIVGRVPTTDEIKKLLQ